MGHIADLPEQAIESAELQRISLRGFWYIIASSEELKPGQILSRTILGEDLAVFRTQSGLPAALQDRCLHRAAPLSAGKVTGERLRCGYHGWEYESSGCLAHVPSLGPETHKLGRRCATSYDVQERDGYVYARLDSTAQSTFEPFAMPHYNEKNWRRVRLVNLFENNVTNCAENFVDIPHTAFVHPGIFRSPRCQKLGASVARRGGSVIVDYRGETNNLGYFSWLLNPSGREIRHRDSFHMPNVTCVEYDFGPRRRFVITSQSIPVTAEKTLVYTDLSYDYGIFNPFAGPLVRDQGQKVIDQDIEILRLQMRTIRKSGENFTHAPADVIHVYIESIRRELESGRDPKLLPAQSQEIEFWV